MTRTPEQIRAEIELTRAELHTDAERLTEKVTPSKIVERKVEGVRGAVSGAKEKLMGSAHDASATAGAAVSDAASGVSGAASSAAGAASDAAHTAVDLAASAPAVAKQKTSGSPLVAGAVAFGVGWLLSQLMPATGKEQQLAQAAKDAAAEPLKQTLTEAVHDLKDEVAPKAAEAVQAVKESGTEAAQAVKETAAGAAEEVKEDVKEKVAEGAQSVQGTVTGSGTSDLEQSSAPAAPPLSTSPVTPPITTPGTTPTGGSTLPPGTTPI